MSSSTTSHTKTTIKRNVNAKDRAYNSMVRNCIKDLSPDAKALAKRLVDNGIVIIEGKTREEIEKDFELLEDTIRTIDSGGLLYALQNYDHDGKPVNVINSDGKEVTGTIRDPVEIYLKLKLSKENAIRAELAKNQALKDAAAQQGRVYAAVQSDIAAARRSGHWSRFDGMRIAT
jgi:hypothetical protein